MHTQLGCTLPIGLPPRIEPVYKTYDGWKTDLENANTFDELPANAKAFLNTLEALLEVPITLVSKGPQRKELIVRYIANSPLTPLSKKRGTTLNSNKVECCYFSTCSINF